MAKMPRLLRGNQAVVHGRFIREVSPLGVLDQIDLADQIGDGDVRRGQFFVIAVVAMHPFDRRIVLLLGDDALAGL